MVLQRLPVILDREAVWHLPSQQRGQVIREILFEDGCGGTENPHRLLQIRVDGGPIGECLHHFTKHRFAQFTPAKQVLHVLQECVFVALVFDINLQGGFLSVDCIQLMFDSGVLVMPMVVEHRQLRHKL